MPVTVTPVLPVTGQSPQVIYTAGDVLAAAALDTGSLNGAGMAGITFTVVRSSGSVTTYTWANLGGTTGGYVDNADLTFGLTGDTFTNRWILVNKKSDQIVSVAINGVPGRVCFDTDLSPKATGSSSGKSLVINVGSGFNPKAVYSHKVRIGGESNEDQYACLSLLFETPITNAGRVEFSADTDKLASGSDFDYDAGTVSGYVSAPGPLGAPALVGFYSYVGAISCPSPLGAARLRAFHDFSAQVADVSPRYVMDLSTPSGEVRAPISSWQATLQTDGQCYVQCVIPACEPYLAAINAATAFTIYRAGSLPGIEISYQMASAVPNFVQLAQGPSRYTANMSGYSAAFAADAGLPASLDRPLLAVRSVFVEPSGMRVRCAVDWLLRPGMRAVHGAVTFDVGSIGYYVADGDQYMDVQEAEVP